MKALKAEVQKIVLAAVQGAIKKAVTAAVLEALEENLPVRLDGKRNRLLTLNQAARHLGCNPVHVTDLIDEGRIAAVDIASRNAGRRCHRIFASSLAAYIESREVKVQPAAPLRRPSVSTLQKL